MEEDSLNQPYPQNNNAAERNQARLNADMDGADYSDNEADQ